MGGITVLRELARRFPGQEFLYFGDTANVPYGSKSPQQIRALVRSAAERIHSKSIDALVIACNTASSLGYEEFEAALPGIPLIDVVEAGVRSAVQADRAGNPVLILGTKATVRSHIYERLIKEENPEFKVFEQACPLLVPLIEEGWIDHPVLHATIEEYVRPHRERGPGVALLACTHYPWIEVAIAQALPGWTVLNSAHAVADILQETFPGVSSVAGTVATGGSLGPGARIQWFFSDPESISPVLLGDAAGVVSRF